MTVLALALKLKDENKKGITHQHLKGKTLAMIFSKSSTRTRVSFETGMYQLGGCALYLSDKDIQIGRGESIADTARVLSRMVDGIMIRTFKQSDVEQLAEFGSIPVINGLTDDYHPCQALADIMTYYEHFKSFDGKLAFVGDGNNVAHSLLISCAKVGLDVSVASPANLKPNSKVVEKAKAIAKATGAKVEVTTDPIAAVSGATAVYTDVWASMGQERQFEEKAGQFAGFQVNAELMGNADKNAIFLHCLPAHRGEEVSGDVIDGPRSLVFDEAENRLHAQKALMVLLMGEEKWRA